MLQIRAEGNKMNQAKNILELRKVPVREKTHNLYFPAHSHAFLSSCRGQESSHPARRATGGSAHPFCTRSQRAALLGSPPSPQSGTQSASSFCNSSASYEKSELGSRCHIFISLLLFHDFSKKSGSNLRHSLVSYF